MTLGCEEKLRSAHNDDYSIIITEYKHKRSGAIYCRIHSNFKDSNNIVDESFIQLCNKYSIKLED